MIHIDTFCTICVINVQTMLTSSTVPSWAVQWVFTGFTIAERLPLRHWRWKGAPRSEAKIWKRSPAMWRNAWEVSPQKHVKRYPLDEKKLMKDFGSHFWLMESQFKVDVQTSESLTTKTPCFICPKFKMEICTSEGEINLKLARKNSSLCPAGNRGKEKERWIKNSYHPFGSCQNTVKNGLPS